MEATAGNGPRRPALWQWARRRAYRLQLRERWRALGVPRVYEVAVDGRPVRFLTDHPYTKWWFHRNRRDGFLGGWHEPSVTAFLVEAIRTRETFVDVGAHLGYFSVLFATRPGHRALAVEFDPSNAFELGRQVAFQPADIRRRIEVVHCGIADAPGELAVPQARPLYPGHAAVPATGDPRDSVRVPILPLDQLVRERGFAPEVVKIDVEGLEERVLEGASEVLERFRPVLLIEVHPEKMGAFGSTPAAVGHRLERAGYRLFTFADHRAHHLSPLSEAWDPGARTNHDLVAVPDSPGTAEMVAAYNRRAAG